MKEFAKKLEEQIRLIEDIQRRLHLLAIEKHQAKLDACEAQLSDWSQRWTPACECVTATRRPSSPDQVGGALAILEKVFDHLKDAERLQYRLKRIGDNIEQFEKRVSQLVAAIDSALEFGFSWSRRCATALAAGGGQQGRDTTRRT